MTHGHLFLQCTELDSFSDTFLYSLCSLEPRLSCERELGSETILYAVRIALNFKLLLLL